MSSSAVAGMREKMGSLKKLIEKPHVSSGATIFLMFIYTFMVNQDLACTCRPQRTECPLYMALPSVIIFVLILWTSRTFLAALRYTCTFCCSEGCRTCCHSFLLLFPKVVHAISVGLLWVAFVLIDGDWFVCCQNNGSEEEMLLGCKKADDLTERERMKTSDLKNWSKLIGGFLLLGIIAVRFLVELLVRIKYCKSIRLSNKKFQFFKLILEEEGGALKEVLRKSAQDQLNEKIKTKINEENWEDCFNVAEELIRKSARPGALGGGASEEQGLLPMERGAVQLEEICSKESGKWKKQRREELSQSMKTQL